MSSGGILCCVKAGVEVDDAIQYRNRRVGRAVPDMVSQRSHDEVTAFLKLDKNDA